jgi:hypothetical protein
MTRAPEDSHTFHENKSVCVTDTRDGQTDTQLVKIMKMEIGCQPKWTARTFTVGSNPAEVMHICLAFLCRVLCRQRPCDGPISRSGIPVKCLNTESWQVKSLCRRKNRVPSGSRRSASNVIRSKWRLTLLQAFIYFKVSRGSEIYKKLIISFCDYISVTFSPDFIRLF